MPLPEPRAVPLTCAQIRDIDVLAIEHVGISSLVLMENAGRSVAEVAYDLLADPSSAKVLVLCGGGNNAGDGFVAARHLSNAGVRVELALSVEPVRLRGDPAANLRILDRAALRSLDATTDSSLPVVEDVMRHADLIIDALLGTGSRGTPRPPLDALISSANRAPRARRLAIDIPSGLDADSGQVWKPCFRADVTVTFVAPKIGFSVASARPWLGRVVVADIGVPRAVLPFAE